MFLVDDHKALVADFGLSQTIDGVRSRSGNSTRQGAPWNASLDGAGVS